MSTLNKLISLEAKQVAKTEEIQSEASSDQAVEDLATDSLLFRQDGEPPGDQGDIEGNPVRPQRELREPDPGRDHVVDEILLDPWEPLINLYRRIRPGFDLHC